MVKIGTIVYSVDKFGDATPYIVWNIEEEFIVCCVSIIPAKWNEDRVCVEMEKIISNCFDENDAHLNNYFGVVCVPKDEKKINRYCKQRFNEK